MHGTRKGTEDEDSSDDEGGIHMVMPAKLCSVYNRSPSVMGSECQTRSCQTWPRQETSKQEASHDEKSKEHREQSGTMIQKLQPRPQQETDKKENREEKNEGIRSHVIKRSRLEFSYIHVSKRVSGFRKNGKPLRTKVWSDERAEEKVRE